jgi:hypothetical protein
VGATLASANTQVWAPVPFAPQMSISLPLAECECSRVATVGAVLPDYRTLLGGRRGRGLAGEQLSYFLGIGGLDEVVVEPGLLSTVLVA